jgi:Tfp pilus assembly protein PilN
MTNLLPPIQKQELLDEKLRQRIIFILFLILIDLLFLIAITFGMYIYISKENSNLGKQIAQKEQLLNEPQSQEIKKIIESANRNLLKINSIKKEQVSPVVILSKLNELVPSTAYLKSFSFQNSVRDNVNIGKIRLTGLAKSRENVFLFKNLLSQNQDFQNIYFDPSSWVKSVDPTFVVEFNFIPAK